MSTQLLITEELERYLTISKMGTYVIETDEFGNTWLKLTSQDAPIEVIVMCPACLEKTAKIQDVMKP